jgi:L-alanine-DL-glutamate epimerase-like enolase superfamily enzyme
MGVSYVRLTNPCRKSTIVYSETDDGLTGVREMSGFEAAWIINAQFAPSLARRDLGDCEVLRQLCVHDVFDQGYPWRMATFLPPSL